MEEYCFVWRRIIFELYFFERSLKDFREASLSEFKKMLEESFEEETEEEASNQATLVNASDQTTIENTKNQATLENTVV